MEKGLIYPWTASIHSGCFINCLLFRHVRRWAPSSLPTANCQTLSLSLPYKFSTIFDRIPLFFFCNMLIRRLRFSSISSRRFNHCSKPSYNPAIKSHNSESFPFSWPLSVVFRRPIKFSRAMAMADGGSEAHKHTNRLAEEHSPYLLQHAHNPVIFLPNFAKFRFFLSGLAAATMKILVICELG